MRAEIVGVGTELLLGQIANTNAQWMGERLAEIGVDVLHQQVVGDNLERITDAFRLALSRSDVVISTGGLGPTQDDITRDAIAAVLGVQLVRHPEIEEMLRERFRQYRREMPEINLLQADVPEGARYILPQRGTAPALVCPAGDGKVLYAVAGVPAEMREMMLGTILPELRSRAGSAAIVSRVLRVTGLAESRVAELLGDVFASTSNPTVAYLASAGEVKVRLTAKAATTAEANALIDPVAAEVSDLLGSNVFTAEDEELEGVVGRVLRERGATVACAESLTGGGLAKRLTAAEGSSDYFRGSAVVYTAEAKRDVLGVRQETIDEFGVVSEECAREMAAGARRVFRADVAVSLTGVAGPDPHDGHPPGEVWIALDAEDVATARHLHSPGDRALVIRWSEQAALDLVRRWAEGRLDG